MPCPVRWMKCSPQPASSMTSRAAASIVLRRHARAGRPPSRPPERPAGRAYHSATSARRRLRRPRRCGCSPTGSRWPSPRRCRRRRRHRPHRPLGQLVVRARAVRAGADDREVHAGVALGEDRRGDVGADLAPRCGPRAATRPCGRARGRWPRRPRPAPRSPPADLTMRSRSTTGLAISSAEPGSARCTPRACSAQVRAPTATRAGADPRRAVAADGEQRERVVGLVPGEQLQAEAAGGAGVHHRRLEPRARPGTAPRAGARPARSAAPSRARCSRRGTAGPSPA